MRLKYTFEPVDMGDEIIAVPVGEGANEVRGIIKLNKEAQEIMDLLKNNVSEEQIVNMLSEKYENDRQTLKSYVKKVVDVLRSTELLEE